MKSSIASIPAPRPAAGAKSTQNLCACRACGSGTARVFLSRRGVPSNSCLLIPTREEAIGCRRGEISLAACPQCGFVFNDEFDPLLTEYSNRYEETQGFSPTFSRFQRDLAARLVERHGLHGRTVLEIGCGKGEFLALLCELGGNRGIGFDPSFIPGREPRTNARFEVIPDLYSERYADVAADFICCKMTLEHIHEPSRLVRTVRRSVADRPGVTVFFQVPNAARILRDCAFEDIYYEHCNYFTPGSLTALFNRCGFEILSLETTYAGQYLTLEARPAASAIDEDGTTDLFPRQIDRFEALFRRKTTAWRRRLADWHASGRQIVLWGSGSKGVAFLTALDLPGLVEHVVDINPHRQGFYMAGTGQRIIPPRDLREIDPAAVVVMNAVYREEIRRELQDLGLEPVLWTV